MQAQTTRTFQGNMQKLAGGLLIAATLAAGTIGLATSSELDISRGSSKQATTASQVYYHPGMGEGWIALARSDSGVTAIGIDPLERSVEELWFAEQPATNTVAGLTLDEIRFRDDNIWDYDARAEPAGSVTHTRLIDAPQGEGFPMIETQQGEPPFNPQGEGLMTGNGQ